MLSYVCFMPCNREFGEMMGEDFGTSNYASLYCGAYILTDWEQNAYRTLKRNPTYWDIDNIHIEELHETFNSEASTLSAELFKRGEIMTAELTASEAQTWLGDPALSQMIRPSRAAFNYSYWYAFNYYIKAADGSYTYPEEYEPENYFLAAQNKNFRKSIFHGFDRVVANVADRIAVMYAGDIVEIGTSEEIFFDSRHPYTWALLSSLPQLGERGEDLFAIEGTPPNLFKPVRGDAFAPRNPYALKIDFEYRPPYFDVSPTHKARTWLLDPRAPRIERPACLERIAEMGVYIHD